MNNPQTNRKNIVLLILVATLLIFMIWFFSVIRVQSLKGIGVPDEELLSIGVQLINAQIIGMLIGGILGDKMGPLKVLFGSILMYSWANIVNRFVADVTTYAKFLKQGKK